MMLSGALCGLCALLIAGVMVVSEQMENPFPLI
jgi:hypothetical protein